MFAIAYMFVLVGTAMFQTTYLHKQCLKLDQLNLGQPGQKCLFCDPQEQFYLSNGTCQATTQLNCALTGQSNICLLCVSGYSLSNGSCTKIPTGFTIDNCLTINYLVGVCTQCKAGFGISATGTCFDNTSKLMTNCINYNYLSPNQCIQCTNGYYLSKTNDCQPTTVTIQNCQSLGVADDNVTVLCIQCQSSYALNVQRTSCLGIPKNNNCSIYSNYTCLTCATGYILSLDAYRIDYYTTKNTAQPNAIQDMNYLFYNSYNNVQQQQDGVKTCIALDTTANCGTFKTYNTCTTCQSGYYMNDVTNRCVSNPLPPIPYCLEYTNNTTCKVCQQKYFTGGPNGTCQAIAVTDVILNCIQYSQTESTKKCILCGIGYFVTSGNLSCTARTYTNIQRCLVYDPLADGCSQCEPQLSYYPLTQQCLPQIPQCSTYAVNQLDANGRLICTKCINMFYISTDPIDQSTRCVQNTIPNCIQSHDRYNYCLNCANQYFGYGTCKEKHNSIPQCLVYNQYKAHFCKQCQDNSVPIVYDTYCAQQNLIQNCDVHTFLDIYSLMCRKCKSGYYPQSPILCTSITSTLNCDIALEDQQCIRCVKGYVLVQKTDGTKTCILPHKYQSNGCQDFYYDATALDATVTNRFGLTTTADQSTGAQLYSTYNTHYCKTCSATPTPTSTDKQFLFNWDKLATGINLNMCIESGANNDKTPFFSNSEYLPQGTNCQVYGSGNSCYRCAPGYFLTYQGATNSACVAKDATTLRCPVNGASKQSLVPFSVVNGAPNITGNLMVKANEYCTTPTGGSNNNTLVQGPNFQSLINTTTPAFSLIDLSCRYFVTQIPDSLVNINLQSYSNLNPFATQTGTNYPTWISNYLDIYPQVKCADPLDNSKFQNTANPPTFTAQATIQNALDNINGNSNSSDLREFWLKVANAGTDYYTRIRCPKWQIPTLYKITEGIDFFGVSCVAIGASETTYSNSIWYPNVHPNEQYAMSIHGCVNSSFVPYVAFSTASKGDLRFTALATRKVLTKNIFCLDHTTNTQAGMLATFNTALGTSLTLSASFLAPVQNCAYGLINLSYDLTDADFKAAYNGASDVYGILADNLAQVCRACKPGYRPTFLTQNPVLGDNENGAVVVSCTAIANCDTTAGVQKYLNSCTSCASTYILDKKTKLIDLFSSDCVRDGAAAFAKATNCLIIDSLSANKDCYICQKGFFLNPNGYCDTVTVAVCTNFQAPISFNTATATNKIYVGLISYYLQTGFGCPTCSVDYTMVNISNTGPNLAMCGVSSILTAASTALTTSVGMFILNCIQFTYDSSTMISKCAKCATGFVPKNDRTSCDANTGALANCAYQSSTAGECSLCNSGYFLFKDAGNSNKQSCSNSGNITNCTTMVSDDQTLTPTNGTALTVQAYVQCLYCAIGYYPKLVSGVHTCALSTIKNCDVPNNQYKCITCKTGYQKFTLISSAANVASIYDYCMPIGQDQTCSYYEFQNVTAFGNTASLSRTFLQASCKKCAITNGQLLKFDSKFENYVQGATISECRKFDKIDNCQQYGNYVSVTTAEDKLLLNCISCNSNYYLDNSAAKLTAKTENSVVTKYSDGCLLRTYLDNRCLKYTVDDDKCAVCAFGTYLDATSSKCKDSPNGALNCRTYSKGPICIECEGDYYLSNNSCIAVTTPVVNCRRYSQDSICDTCSGSTFLNKTLNTCVTNTLSNCVQQLNDTTCTVCANGYGLRSSDGTCVATTNCLTPDNKGTCAVCNSGYYSDTNGACQQVTALINNCNLYTSNTLCSQCSSGYALHYTATSCLLIDQKDAMCSNYVLNTALQCQACPVGYNYINGSCSALPQPEQAKLGCDIFNGQTQTCEYCLSTYTMNYSGLCNSTSTLSLLQQPQPVSTEGRLLR